MIALSAQGFNEGKGKPFTGEDIRFTTKANALYAIVLGAPQNNKVTIKSLKLNSDYYPQQIGKVLLLQDNAPLTFNRTAKGLEVDLPQNLSQAFAYTLKILPA